MNSLITGDQPHFIPLKSIDVHIIFKLSFIYTYSKILLLSSRVAVVVVVVVVVVIVMCGYDHCGIKVISLNGEPMVVENNL